MRLVVFIIRRILLLIPVWLGILLITFTLARVVPSDPVRFAAGANATPEMIEALRHQYGFDRPLPEQFVSYVVSVTQGDLGRSLNTRRPVLEDVQRFYPATLELVLVGICIALIVGIPAGVISSAFANRAPDYVVRLFTFGLVSLPNFWLALVLQLIAVRFIRFFPISGRFDPNVTPPATITGLFLVDSLLELDWPRFMIALKHIALPAVALSMPALATVTRMTRAGMIETLRKDFVVTARASGVPETVILLKHALRHALITILSIIGLNVTWMMAGSVLVETIFSWPGLGYYALNSSLLLDYNPLMGVILVYGITCGLTNMITDISYAVVDPRIRKGFG